MISVEEGLAARTAVQKAKEEEWAAIRKQQIKDIRVKIDKCLADGSFRMNHDLKISNEEFQKEVCELLKEYSENGWHYRWSVMHGCSEFGEWMWIHFFESAGAKAAEEMGLKNELRDISYNFPMLFFVFLVLLSIVIYSLHPM